MLVTSPADFGALVREARERRGWTQTNLGARIGASRFWVAAFERGKPGVELGLALRAAAAVGLRLRADRPARSARRGDAPSKVGDANSVVARGGAAPRGHDAGLNVDLDEIVGAAPQAVRPAPGGA